MKPVLLLDMDGVIADFDRQIWDLANDFGFELDIESLEDPGRKRYLTENIPDRAQRRTVRGWIDESHWFRELPVLDGAQEGVAELEEHFDVWLCTKPLEVNPYCRDDKAAWVREHMPQLERKLIITPNKGLVDGRVLLDDAPKKDHHSIASWRPVIYRTPFSQSDPFLSRFPSFQWGEPLDDVLLAEAARL